jgi:cytoplasmic iron level regulating protein YaaA (DUF328/UPF0246 family)
MHIILSPAKSMDFETPTPVKNQSSIHFGNESEALASILKTKSTQDLENLMGISPKLAKLNYERFQNWHLPFAKNEARQAIFAFKGDVYTGLDAYSLPESIIQEAQNKLFILSGLHGVLKPLDGILPYRLEMGSKLKNTKGEHLYHFWGDKITHYINQEMSLNRSNTLINLASNEYFKSINKKILKADIITPEFKDLKNGTYKVVSFFAKKARGLMTRFILEHKLSKPEELLAFNADGYYYNAALSQSNKPVFTRDRE